MSDRTFIQRLPNLLTSTRLIGTVPAAVLFALGSIIPLCYTLGFVLVIILCLTDALDGQIARRFDAVTSDGKHADPLADKALVLLFLVPIARGNVHFLPIFMLLLRDYLVTSMRDVASRHSDTISARFSGKIKTVIAFPYLLLSLVTRAPDATALATYFSPLEPAVGPIGWFFVAIIVWSGIDYYCDFRKRGYELPGFALISELTVTNRKG